MVRTANTLACMSTDSSAPALNPLDRATESAADLPVTIGAVSAPPTHTISDEPRPPWSIWAAVSSAYVGVAVVVAGLLVAFYLSKDVDRFAGAAWINGVVETEPGSLLRVAMVTVLFAITLVVSAGAVVSGYYAWRGFRWTRIACLVSLGIALLTLLGNMWMVASLIPLALSSAAIWMPASGAFFDAWQTARHPSRPARSDVSAVRYGPLPKYVA